MTRTLAVRIAPNFTEDDPRRAINQSVTVDVPVGAARDVVSVHKDGVIAQGDGYMVFVAVDGRAVPRPVRIGDAIGSRYVVEGGLAPGDIVIVRGNERVRPGMPVVFRKGS
jgi:multidrug efflux pump subunit AcrA (membrane-fusion protein)